MKSISEIINENNIEEQQIDESFGAALYIGVEIALLSATVALFVKSFKDIVKGENGILDVIGKLRENNQIMKLCKKLAKDDDVRKFLASKDNVKKNAWQELITSKLSEKEATQFMDITREMVAEYVK